MAIAKTQQAADRSLPRRLLTDTDWRFAGLRIGVLTAIGWLLLKATATPMPAPDTLERLWPETDFSRRSVELHELDPGGPARDGIPALVDPPMQAAARIDWLADDAPVIVVAVGGESRAYPIEILVWHEIVNDNLGGVPVAVTFCPLCNAALVFDRRVDGQVLEFGTTGWLRKSDLLMYDRSSFSWWQQLTGSAIIGAFTGQRLDELPAQIVGFGSFRSRHPEGLVLSRRTGYWRDYGKNPYVGYDSIQGNPLLPGKDDPRLRPMQRVLVVRNDRWARLYPLDAIGKQDPINDRAHGLDILVVATGSVRSVLDRERIERSRRHPAAAAFERRLDGRELNFTRIEDQIRDRETGSNWDLFGCAESGPLAGRCLRPLPGGVHFAFAWLAFHPDSEIWVARKDGPNPGKQPPSSRRTPGPSVGRAAMLNTGSQRSPGRRRLRSLVLRFDLPATKSPRYAVSPGNDRRAAARTTPSGR